MDRARPRASSASERLATTLTLRKEPALRKMAASERPIRLAVTVISCCAASSVVSPPNTRPHVSACDNRSGRLFLGVTGEGNDCDCTKALTVFKTTFFTPEYLLNTSTAQASKTLRFGALVWCRFSVEDCRGDLDKLDLCISLFVGQRDFVC